MSSANHQALSAKRQVPSAKRRVHSAKQSGTISDGGRSGMVQLQSCTGALQAGGEYCLKWKSADGWIFSGKLFAESEKFKVVSLQSILMETEVQKQHARQAAMKATSAAASPAPRAAKRKLEDEEADRPMVSRAERKASSTRLTKAWDPTILSP